jgi:hypothetical protein
MKMLKNKKFLFIIGAILALISFGVWATTATVTWTPSRYAPYSIIPGQSTTTTVTFTNNGPSTINGKKLVLEILGDVAGIATVTPPNFPVTIKKGERVSVNLSVKSPTNAPIRVVSGTLVLFEMKPDGKTKDVFSATLPIEITLSPISVPPDPSEFGKMTVEGVITNQYKIRDDVLRAIVFAFPTSEPIRNVLIQYSQAYQKMAEDYLALANNPVEQKRVVRLDAKEGDKAQDCMSHVFGVHSLPTLDERLAKLDEIDNARHAVNFVFLNTKERSRVYDKTDALLGGTTSDSVVASEQAAYDAASCDTNLLD